MNTSSKHALRLFVAASGFAALCGAAQAADGTINFNGAVTAQTCTINGGVNPINVVLPTVSTTSLVTAGQTAGSTPFSITLTGCTPASGSVSAFFESGPTVDQATGTLINQSGGGATNTNIQVTNTNSSIINLAGSLATQAASTFVLSSGSATMNYRARYITNTGSATAGPVTSTVDYTVNYQ